MGTDLSKLIGSSEIHLANLTAAMFQCFMLDQIPPFPKVITAEVTVFVAVFVHVLKLLFLGVESAITAAAAVLHGIIDKVAQRFPVD